MFFILNRGLAYFFLPGTVLDLYICKCPILDKELIMKTRKTIELENQENEFLLDDEMDLQEEDMDVTKEQQSSDMDSHDSIKCYLKEVSLYKLLNFEEEKELSRRIEAGDEDALNELIQSNLRLVIKIAKAFVSKDYPLIDIIQDGNIGLIRAAQKYDYRKNVRFSTYAAQWIKQMIIRALAQKRRMVRLPYRKEKTLKKIKDFTSQFYNENKRYPTDAEVSKELGLKAEEVEVTRYSEVNTSSLDATLMDDDNFSLDQVVGTDAFNPDDTLEKKDFFAEMEEAINSLVPKEKDIIIHRFGLYAEEKQTLKEMGEQFGISAETVRQIENRTLKKLEENHQHLKEYILR